MATAYGYAIEQHNEVTCLLIAGILLVAVVLRQ
jgi:hypothetical protein